MIGKTFYNYQEEECKIIDKGKGKLKSGEEVTIYFYEEKCIINNEVNIFNRTITESDLNTLLEKQDKIVSYMKRKEECKVKEKLQKEKEEKEYNDIDGFAADKSPMQLARIRKTLNREQKYSGKYYPARKQFIRESISNGYTVDYKEGEGRIFLSPNGSWYANLTKTELDYAEYLINNNFYISKKEMITNETN